VLSKRNDIFQYPGPQTLHFKLFRKGTRKLLPVVKIILIDFTGQTSLLNSTRFDDKSKGKKIDATVFQLSVPLFC
jgi:hypothetical protein